MDTLQALDLTVKTMEAYIFTNQEVLEKDELDKLNEALAALYDEQRLWHRTIMLVDIDESDTTEVVDITEFCQLQYSYDNDVDPSVLNTVAQLIYQNTTVQVIGWSSPIDFEYWCSVLIDCYEGNKDRRYKTFAAIQSWIKCNK